MDVEGQIDTASHDTSESVMSQFVVDDHSATTQPKAYFLRCVRDMLTIYFLGLDKSFTLGQMDHKRFGDEYWSH